MSETVTEKIDLDYLYFVDNSNVIDINKICLETQKNVILGTVYNIIRYGFDEELNNESLKTFVAIIPIDKEIVMWAYRVVISMSLRKNLLK